MITSESLLQTLPAWLDGFLTHRHHKKQHNVPLYQYQMTRSEYQSLRHCLAQSRAFVSHLSPSREWCGAFTLYCAEWFRREYTLAWSWEPIFSSLGFRLEPNEIADVVERGLNGYWGRYVSQSHAKQHHYLGSVFREGGLPSHLLANDDNYYQSTFYSIFERYQETKELGSHAIDALIRHRVTRLPKTLQSEESIELITSMVEQLDSLVYHFDLVNQANPAQYLDQQRPGWRDNFPLPLEDTVGSEFLSALLSQATKEVQKASRQRGPLSCHHIISVINQAVYSELGFPQVLAFPISKLQLSSYRLELVILEGDQPIASLGTVYAQCEQNQAHIRVRQAKLRLKRYDAGCDLYIAAMQAGNKLAELRLSASALEMGSVPLTLQPSDEEWKVIGQASLTTKVEQVGLLYPSNADWSVEYGAMEHEESPFQGMKFCRFSGKAKMTLASHEGYTIKTGAETFDASNLTLRGDLLRWKTNPPLVFRGLPKVAKELNVESTDSTLVTYLDSERLENLRRSEVNGKRVLIVKNDHGDVMLRKTVGILPSDFDIQLLGGDSPNFGTVRIVTSFPCVCTIKTPDVVASKPVKKTGVMDIAVRTITAMPPMTITLKIQASVLAEPILIDVPFPARGALAYNEQGEALPPRLTIEDLLGSRLYLFPNQGTAARFQIEAVAKSYHEHTHKPFYRWNYNVVDRPLEISLYSLKDPLLELLSLASHLDSLVELSVSGAGRTLRYIISHYATSLDENPANNTVFLRTGSSTLAKKARLILMSLADPAQKPIPLLSRQSEGVATGEFELPSCIKHNGPWLIVPDRDSQVSFRAKFYPCGATSINTDHIDSLQKASMCFHPATHPNVIADVIAQMAGDFTHSSWQYIDDTYKHYGYLPLTTFEVLRHLVKNRRALALSALRFIHNEQFIAQLTRELSIFWELLPLADWQLALKTMQLSLRKLAISDEQIDEMCHSTIDKLVEIIPAFAGVIQDYLSCNALPENPPQCSFEAVISSRYQFMLHQHAEAVHWPDYYSAEISQICLQNNLLPFALPVFKGYHTGVVYLPLFAAAIASGRLPIEIFDQFPSDFVFHIRKLRDFDLEWFEYLYSCYVAYFLNQI